MLELEQSQGVECKVGIAERAVRMIILMIGAVIGYLTSPIYFTYIIIILVILSYITVGQRIYHVWNNLNEWFRKCRKISIDIKKLERNLKQVEDINFEGKEKEVYDRAVDYMNDSKYYLERKRYAYSIWMYWIQSWIIRCS